MGEGEPAPVWIQHSGTKRFDGSSFAGIPSFMPEPATPERREPPPVDRSSWPRPWAQLKYITFHPAIFPRLLGKVSPDARPGDWVAVFDKNGERAGSGLYNPRAKIPLRVVVHSPEPVG